MRTCVIIPAYNEGLVLTQVLENAQAAFCKSTFKIDIVVVNDGSKDTTAADASRSGAITINHILNSGAGAATATGLSYASQNGYDFAATMDADGQHRPEDVIEGIRKITQVNADLLIGSRLIDSRGMSPIKLVGNKGLSIITYVLFGINVTDSQSGLRIFSKKALEQLRWQTSGYEFCSEMLWRARQQGMNVEEYAIEAIYTDYSKSKGQNNWNGVNIVKSLVKRRILEFFG